jgi:hypothetical protein
MKTFIATVLTASTYAYLQENSYAFIDVNNKQYTSGITTLVDANGYVMTVDFEHSQDAQSEYTLNACIKLTVPEPTNSRSYYWGLMFKPSEPVTETNYDGIQFYALYTTSGYATLTPDMYDSWKITTTALDTNTNGAKTTYLDRDTNNDWT